MKILKISNNQEYSIIPLMIEKYEMKYMYGKIYLYTIIYYSIYILIYFIIVLKNTFSLRF